MHLVGFVLMHVCGFGYTLFHDIESNIGPARDCPLQGKAADDIQKDAYSIMEERREEMEEIPAKSSNHCMNLCR